MLFYFATAPSYNVIFSNIKPIFSSSVLYFLLYTQKDKASCSLGNFAFHTTSLLYHLFHTEQSYFLLSPPFIFSTFSSHSDIFRIIRSVYCRQRLLSCSSICLMRRTYLSSLSSSHSVAYHSPEILSFFDGAYLSMTASYMLLPDRYIKR